MKRPTLCLGFETALLYWRAVHEGRLPPPEPLHDTSLPERCVTGLKELCGANLSSLGIRVTSSGIIGIYERERLGWGPPVICGSERMVPRGLAIPPGETRPIHLLTACRQDRRKHPAIHAHLLSRKLPPCALCAIDEGVWVVSAEFAYLQACLPGRDLPNIELAHELSGTYALNNAALPCRFHCQPVTSTDRLGEFLQNMACYRGIPAVKRALVCGADGLASPRESELFLLLTLDIEAGGYGLPSPEVNGVVSVAGTPADVLTRASHYEVDLVWLAKKVVVEYDGFDDHESTPEKVAADKERRSVLAAMGYTVIVVTKRDFASEASLRTKVAQIAMALGVELPAPTEEQVEARRALLRWLGNPMHDHLPFGYGYR